MLPFMYNREVSYVKTPPNNNKLVHIKKRTIAKEQYLDSILNTPEQIVLELFASTGVYGVWA